MGLKTLIIKIVSAIKEASKDKTGKLSHARVSSFFILGSILTSSLTFICIEVVNAIVSWNVGATYIIPSSHITLFGMILGHHLILLGVSKNSKSEPQG